MLNADQACPRVRLIFRTCCSIFTLGDFAMLLENLLVLALLGFSHRFMSTSKGQVQSFKVHGNSAVNSFMLVVS